MPGLPKVVIRHSYEIVYGQVLHANCTGSVVPMEMELEKCKSKSSKLKDGRHGKSDTGELHQRHHVCRLHAQRNRTQQARRATRSRNSLLHIRCTTKHVNRHDQTENWEGGNMAHHTSDRSKKVK